MSDIRDNEQFSERASELFDDSVERLDAAALSRLNQGRHRALAEAARPGARGRLLRWAPVSGVVAAAVVAVVVMNSPMMTATEEVITATDFEMLLEDDSLDMLDELEFYSWLESAEPDANGDVG